MRLGAPIPCKGEPTIGVFDPVFADVGDAQSAEGNVSTYVGHLRVAAAAVAEARSSRTSWTTAHSLCVRRTRDL